MKDQYLNSVVGKFFVCQFQAGNLFSSTEIEKETYDRISEVNKSIRRIQYYKNKTLECMLNQADYFTYVNKYFSLLKNPIEQLQKFNHEWAKMDINRVFNNFVISFKAMYEHTEKMIIKHYSKNSYEFKEFKGFTSHHYDLLFSYRLFIRLRNYTTHYSEPVNLKINLTSGAEPELIPQFRKSELLRFAEIRKKLQSDLASYDEVFPVEPLMNEIDDYIKMFYPMIVRIVANTEMHNITELLTFYRRHKEENNLSMSLGSPKAFVDDRLDMNFISLEIGDALEIEKMIA